MQTPPTDRNYKFDFLFNNLLKYLKINNYYYKIEKSMEGNINWYAPQITIAQNSGQSNLALSQSQSKLLWDRVFSDFMNLYYYDKTGNQNSFDAVFSRFKKDFRNGKETPIVRAFRVYLCATNWEDISYRRDLWEEVKEGNKQLAKIKRDDKDKIKIKEAKKIKKEKEKPKKQKPKEKKVEEKIEDKVDDFALISDDEVDDLLNDNKFKCGRCGDIYKRNLLMGEVTGIKICSNCYTEEDLKQEEKEDDERFLEETNIKLDTQSEDEEDSSSSDEDGVYDLEKEWYKNLEKNKKDPEPKLPQVEGKLLCEGDMRYIEGEDYELWKTLKKARDKKMECIGYVDSELNSLVDLYNLYDLMIWVMKAKEFQRDMMDWILE